MGDFIIFLAIADCILLAIFIIRDRTEQSRRRLQLKVPYRMPYHENCREAFKQTLSFVNDRVWEIHNKAFIANEVGMDKSFISLYDSQEIPYLYSIAHMSGYRVVLYKEDDKDVENPDNTPEKMKKYHKDIKIALHKRIEKKYGR